VLGRFPSGPFPFTDNPLLGDSFWTARLAAFHVIGKYLALLVWPARLAPDYSYSAIPAAVDAQALVALALCIGAGALAIWSWRRHKPLFFAIVFFFVTLAPVSNVFVLIGSIMAERFLYLPAVGFFAAVVYGLRAVALRAPRARTTVAAAIAVVLLAFAARAYARNADWLDGRRFWESAVRAVPDNYKAPLNFAGTLPLLRPEDRQRAAANVGRALAILDPLPDERNSGFAYREAGVTYRELGDELALKRAAPDGTEPAEWYRKSLDALLRSERIEQALDRTYRDINARRGAPQSTFLPSVLYLELGRTRLRLLQHPEAIAAFEHGRALESNPDLLEELGATYEALEQPRKAAQSFIEAMEMDSRRTNLMEKLVALYAKVDPQGCAVSHEGGAASLNLACPLVHSDICAGARNAAANYLRRNQAAEAASIRRVAAVDLGCAEEALK
jgi:tetratricopeptide (TPR) repeat protein